MICNRDPRNTENSYNQSTEDLFFIISWLYSTAPFHYPGRPHRQEKWRLNPGVNKAGARRMRTAVDRARGLLILSYCVMAEIMSESERQMIVDYGRASLPAIGHYTGMHEMIAAAKKVLVEIEERQRQPRAGWDVEGTGARRRPRSRVRDIIS